MSIRNIVDRKNTRLYNRKAVYKREAGGHEK